MVSAHCWRKHSIALQIQKEPLEERSQVEDAIATTLEDLDLVVEPRHKAAVVTLEEAIGDLLPPVIQGRKEALVTLQAPSLPPPGAPS